MNDSSSPQPPSDWPYGIICGIFSGLLMGAIAWTIGITVISATWWHAPLVWVAGTGTWLLGHLPLRLHQLGVPRSIAPVAAIGRWPNGLSTEIGIATCSALAMGSLSGLVVGIWVADVPGERYVEGRYLVTSTKRFARILRQRESSDGVRIHPEISLARDRERQHVLAIGASGSGKSQVLHRLIGSSILRGDQQLIYDYKNDFIPFYYDADTTLIAPWDVRSAAWDIAADVPDLAAARELAAGLIPLPQSGDSKWASGARQVLTGLVVALQQQPGGWSIADLSRIASADGETIAATLRQHFPEAAALLANPTTNPATSYLASLIDYLAPIHDLARLESNDTNKGHRRWSVRRWLEGGELPRVIVGHDQGQGDLSRFIIAALLRLVLQRVGSVNFETPTDPTWLFIDELLQAGKIESIVNLAETARDKGVRLVLACQSIERLREVYGRESADALAGGVGTLVIGRCRGETARWASDQVGEQQLERYRASFSDTGKTRYWERVSEPVTRPEAFDGELGTYGHGRRKHNRLLLVTGGNAVARLDWPLWSLQPMASAHVPWTAPVKPESSVGIQNNPHTVAEPTPAGAAPVSDTPDRGMHGLSTSTRTKRLQRLKATRKARADRDGTGAE